MEMHAIKGESYSVEYQPETVTVKFQGSMRLNGMADYAPTEKLLNEAIDQSPPIITLNLRELEFLNSSGISMLSKFVINVRKKKTVQIAILGSNRIPWQGKSLKNLQRLMPGLEMEFE